VKPLSNFQPESDEKTEHPSSVVWARILDKRFCYEVQRKEPYKGVLVIFDSKNDYKEIFNKEVVIAFDARFGADVSDTLEWDGFVIDYIDNKFKE
jgi:hypothetical protein